MCLSLEIPERINLTSKYLIVYFLSFIAGLSSSFCNLVGKWNSQIQLLLRYKSLNIFYVYYLTKMLKNKTRLQNKTFTHRDSKLLQKRDDCFKLKMFYTSKDQNTRYFNFNSQFQSFFKNFFSLNKIGCCSKECDVQYSVLKIPTNTIFKELPRLAHQPVLSGRAATSQHRKEQVGKESTDVTAGAKFQLLITKTLDLFFVPFPIMQRSPSVWKKQSLYIV